MITGNRVTLPCRYYKIEKLADGGYLGQCERLDREEAYDDGDDESVEVVREKRRLDTTNESVKNDTGW